MPTHSRPRLDHAPDLRAVATLFVLITLMACGTDQSTNIPEGECGWRGAGASSYTLGTSGASPLPISGTQTRWDHNLRLISLGPEDVAEDEWDLAVTMVIGEPVFTTTCEAPVTWANVVAHEVQVGTGDEIAARYYELVDGGCGEGAGSGVKIESIGRDAIVVSALCLTVQRIIVNPNGSGGRGEILRLGGSFTAVPE